jgi:hypothetical protein
MSLLLRTFQSASSLSFFSPLLRPFVLILFLYLLFTIRHSFDCTAVLPSLSSVSIHSLHSHHSCVSLPAIPNVMLMKSIHPWSSWPRSHSQLSCPSFKASACIETITALNSSFIFDLQTSLLYLHSKSSTLSLDLRHSSQALHLFSFLLHILSYTFSLTNYLLHILFCHSTTNCPQASVKMRSTHYPSSPPSNEGTAPTPSTKNTVDTTVTEDDLVAAVGGLSITQEKR